MGGINLSPMVNLWIKHRQTWNITIIMLKFKIVDHILILRKASKVVTSRSVYSSLKEAEKQFKICGDKVEALRSYS